MRWKTIIGLSMRVSALAYGGLLVMASGPLSLLALAAPGDAAAPSYFLWVLPAGALLIASGFVYVGVFGARLAHSRTHALAAGALLSPAMLAGAWLSTPALRQGWYDPGLWILLPALLLFAGAVWPWHMTSRTQQTHIAKDPA